MELILYKSMSQTRVSPANSNIVNSYSGNNITNDITNDDNDNKNNNSITNDVNNNNEIDRHTNWLNSVKSGISSLGIYIYISNISI